MGLMIPSSQGNSGWCRTSRMNWARNSALPEAGQLANAGDRDAAMRLLREAAAIIPEEEERLALVAVTLAVELGVPTSMRSTRPAIPHCMEPRPLV